MSETLLDFSSQLSDYEYVTENKIRNTVEPTHIDHIFVNNVGENIQIQNFVVLFPKKDFFFTVTLYGGGSSGIKPSYNSTVATGGYSSGCIVRFPIQIKNNAGLHFAKVFIGKGGESFKITDNKLINNGEYSNFDLVVGKESIPELSYKTEKGRKNAGLTGMVEGLSSYGSGLLIDGSVSSVIEETSTFSYYSFIGSNANNTSVFGSTGEHRNFYCPYMSTFDGYNSFIGVGGKYLGDIDGEENTGAGGAGVLNQSSDRVGKGGNGGCIIEYEGSERIEVFAENYLYVQRGNNKIVFLIFDNYLGKREVEIVIDEGIYSVYYLASMIQANLNSTTMSTVEVKDSFLVIKMIDEYGIDLGKSSADLLVNFGIMTKDVVKDDNTVNKSPIIDGLYQIKFTNPMNSVCNMNLFEKYKVFG